MKSTLFTLTFLFMTISLSQARLNKTVEVTAGNLESILTAGDLDTVTHLTLKGSLDYRDFALFRSGKFYSLTDLNLKEVSIEAYGTYKKNILPNKSFVFCIDLKNVTLPTSLIVIEDSAFYSCTGLRSVTILDSTTTIGIGAFRKCYRLNTVILPPSLKIIGNYAFELCQALSSMTLPASVTYIGDIAFSPSPFDTPIPDSVKHLGSGAFSNTNITQANIPPTLDSIPDFAFSGCSYLTSVSILGTVHYIGINAFKSSGITEVTLPTSIDSIRESTFSDCTKLASVTLPGTISYIGDYAFKNCSGLTTISLPASVTKIGDYAFYNCSGLTSFHIEAPTPIDLTTSYHVFDFIDKHLCTLYVPAGSLNAYENAVGWNDFVRISESKDSVTYETGDTTSIVKRVSISAGGLRTVLTDNELKNITELTVSGDIDYRDFVTMRYWMPKLSIVDLKGTTVKEYNSKYQDDEIPYDAFRNCNALTKVILPSKLLSIDEYVFCNCTSLKEIVFSDTLFNISNYAFLGCASLVSVECPSEMGIIGDGVFTDCTSLERLTLPNSIQYIGSLAFCGCARLEEVSIPSGMYYISSSTFAMCTNLSKVTFSEKLEVIGSWAFAACIGLTSLTIPESVNLIEDAAFIGCKNVCAIYSPSEWPADCGSEIVFSGVNSSCKLYVPIDSKIKYQNAMGWSQLKDITETEMVSQQSERESNLWIWLDQSSEILNLEHVGDAVRIDVIDLNGNIRRSMSGSKSLSISMKGLADGLYFVQVTSAKKRFVQKIVKRSN
jgi:hypothetical protein